MKYKRNENKNRCYLRELETFRDDEIYSHYDKCNPNKQEAKKYECVETRANAHVEIMNEKLVQLRRRRKKRPKIIIC